ncbi:hypothetical protein Tco_0644638 [Tanacetum coccineum]
MIYTIGFIHYSIYTITQDNQDRDLVLRRKKEKSLDYNNSFLDEYECSSLALHREEMRDEKKILDYLKQDQKMQENPTVTAGGPGSPKYILGPPGLSEGHRRLTLPFLSFSGQGFICIAAECKVFVKEDEEFMMILKNMDGFLRLLTACVYFLDFKRGSRSSRT